MGILEKKQIYSLEFMFLLYFVCGAAECGLKLDDENGKASAMKLLTRWIS